MTNIKSKYVLSCQQEQILVGIKMDGFAAIINKIDYNKFEKVK